MRILHFDLDDLRNPWGGGQARRTYEVSRRLATWFGWDVTVVTGTYPGARPSDVPTVRGRLRYERAGAGRFPWNVLSFVAALPLVARTIPHDLAIEDFTTPIGPSMLPRLASGPVVGSAQFLFASNMARKYWLPFDRVADALLPGYRHLIALTVHGQRTLQASAPGASVHQIPQGLDSSAFADPNSIDGTGEHALFIGRLDRDQKGLDTLLGAWSLMAAPERPPLVIAGDGRDGPALHREVADRGLKASVRFVGRIDGDQKAKLFRRARLVIMPSRYETFGIVAVEAMAAGVPLIASNLPELREVAGDGAWLVPPADPAVLSAAIQSLWVDRDRRIALGTAGRASVEGLTWDHVATAQAAVYSASLGQSDA
jgi:glycosyltransferase involved in cell wall biosynthesis